MHNYNIQAGQKIQIKAYKYPSRLHYEWEAEIIQITEQYIMVACHAERIFHHHTKQKQFIMPYPSIEIFYFNEWFTFSVSFREQGERMYYCNIAMPSQIVDGAVTFVDLDLDYLKEPNEDWKVVDEQEFIHNQNALQYPQALIDGAKNALTHLQQIVSEKHFPFNGEIDINLYESVL